MVPADTVRRSSIELFPLPLLTLEDDQDPFLMLKRREYHKCAVDYLTFHIDLLIEI